MLKAYKYMIYPNKQQEKLIQKTFGYGIGTIYYIVHIY